MLTQLLTGHTSNFALIGLLISFSAAKTTFSGCGFEKIHLHVVNNTLLLRDYSPNFGFFGTMGLAVMHNTYVLINQNISINSCVCWCRFHCQTAELIRLKFGKWSPCNRMRVINTCGCGFITAMPMQSCFCCQKLKDQLG